MELPERDGDIGSATEFLFDDQYWAIRYLVANAPEYTDESSLTRDYETGLYGHYIREGYWVEELAAL
jgi:hypothetical protein